MAQSAVALLTDRTLHDRIVTAARQIVHERFCDEKIVPAYEAYYKEVIAG
jgi:hypothetical protein